MAQVCSGCGESVFRTRFSGGKWLGVDCGCSRDAIIVDSDNPFRNNGELVLEHVHDSDGKPLRVTSIRQLEAAQNRLHFNHIPTNMDRANWDRPKQQRAYTVGDHYQRKFARA